MKPNWALRCCSFIHTDDISKTRRCTLFDCFGDLGPGLSAWMSFLFRAKAKTPHELVVLVKEASLGLRPSSGKAPERAAKDAFKYLALTKNIYSECGPDAELIATLAQEAYSAGLLEILCDSLPYYDFESRKAAAVIFTCLLKRKIGNRSPTVDYICTHQGILTTLLKGYETKDIAMNCGLMLRECIKFEQLAQILIDTGEFYRLFEYIELPTFDIASDAFATFETLLTRHKMLTATLFIESYERVMPEFNKLLCSENYVTRRQSLKLMVELLSDKLNDSMTRMYLMSADNLKIVMNLMKDSSQSISCEALKVFRAFLGHPARPKTVNDILLKNQERLLSFMDNFYPDADEEDLVEDKAFCKELIGDLVPRSDDVQGVGHHLEPC